MNLDITTKEGYDKSPAPCVGRIVLWGWPPPSSGCLPRAFGILQVSP